MKQRFLVADDFGMGGVWAYLWAESEDEIRRNYPALQIVNETPDWLKRGDAKVSELDVDDDSDERLAALPLAELPALAQRD